ncbi:MAG: caspase family protein [Pyrinomonadaceae bacterium]
MKSRSKLFRLALLALALSLALPPARRSDARQSEGLARGAVGIRVEDGKELKLYEKSYALVVGVSDYTRGWPRLPGVRKDIEDVARALERHGFLVTKVENPDAAQLEKSFKEFIDAYGRGIETRLLFYFAGHGHTVKQSYGEEMGYVVPADAPLPASDPAGFMSKAMDMQQMELYARRIQSKHALFLFDSCFSGALFALSRAVPESISYKTARPVRQFITSGSADEQVPDQSIFRRQFVEALDGEADVNRDGYVTGTELGEFLQDKVINYSRNAQHPQYGKIRNPNLDKGDFVFALPKAAATPAPTVATGTPTPAPPARVDAAAVELAFWDTIKNSNDPEEYKDYLAKYPNGQFATIARRRSQPSTPKDASPEPTPTPSTPKDALPEPTPKPSSSSSSFFPVRVRVRADNANNGWTDTGLRVLKGQRLRFTATGRVSLGWGRFSTPTGLPRVADINKLMRSEPTGLLIAVIGDNNDEFIAVGGSREFYAPRDGRLFLGVNEGTLDDNTGTYDVLVEVEPVNQ